MNDDDTQSDALEGFNDWAIAMNHPWLVTPRSKDEELAKLAARSAWIAATRRTKKYPKIDRDLIALRDEFAGRALQVFLMHHTEAFQVAAKERDMTLDDLTAEQCYLVADAMLRERDKEKEAR